MKYIQEIVPVPKMLAWCMGVSTFLTLILTIAP